jgi:hypothetical protein
MPFGSTGEPALIAALAALAAAAPAAHRHVTVKCALTGLALPALAMTTP